MKNFLLFGIVIIFFTSCQDVKYYKISGETQGTTYHIIYNKDKELQPQIDSILKEIDYSLSKYHANSILYKINNNEKVKLDKHFVTVFNKAIEISEKTDGMFDITVGPLVDIYGFGKDKKGNVSDSAIAQGYSVDVISNYFDRNGIDNYMVEVGGETKCKGNNEFGGEWRIGIEKPIENTEINNRQVELIVKFDDVQKALATSGNYRKYFVENGVKFTHTINPSTGRPTKDSLLSVSILSDDCMTADGYATACLVSGYEKAVKIVESNPELEAFFIYFDKDGNYQFYFSDGFKKYIEE